MRLSDRSREINIVCPVCGSDQFEASDNISESTEVFRCRSCDLETTKDDLFESNYDNIDKGDLYLLTRYQFERQKNATSR